jgi:hypothetical protein
MSNHFPRRLPLLAIFLALVAPGALAGSPTASSGESYTDTRAHIENLLAQYMWAFDTQDAEGYAALFTADGEVINTGADIKTPVVFHGHDELKAFIEVIRQRTQMPKHAELQFSPNIHFTNNLVLTVNGDKASGKLYWFTVRRGENHDQITEYNPNPAFFASIGRYEQEYVRQNGTWLFKRVTIAEMGTPAARVAAPATSPKP